ncbi:MAG: DUF3365 domain-containing protein [Gemmatimonadota bacterium]
MRHEIVILRPLPLLAALALAACGGSSSDADDLPDQGAATEASAGAWTPSSAEIERATEIGREAAGRLAATLMQQLSTEMAEGGPEAAIEFCSDEAMDLTHGVNTALGDLDVKRTSTRVRNPENAPDALEQAALSHFESEIEGGSLPENWIQTAGDDELRYYQPLIVNEMCTQCHGPADALQPAVRTRLETLYPQDRAIGYAPGDFRGLIRVAIPREALDEG